MLPWKVLLLFVVSWPLDKPFCFRLSISYSLLCLSPSNSDLCCFLFSCSCTWILLSTFLTPGLFSSWSLVTVFFGDLAVSPAVLVWQSCHLNGLRCLNFVHVQSVSNVSSVYWSVETWHWTYDRLKPRLLSEKLERWKFVSQLLNMWCELYNSQQSFLCEVRSVVVLVMYKYGLL